MKEVVYVEVYVVEKTYMSIYTSFGLPVTSTIACTVLFEQHRNFGYQIYMTRSVLKIVHPTNCRNSVRNSFWENFDDMVISENTSEIQIPVISRN